MKYRPPLRRQLGAVVCLTGVKAQTARSGRMRRVVPGLPLQKSRLLSSKGQSLLQMGSSPQRGTQATLQRQARYFTMQTSRIGWYHLAPSIRMRWLQQVRRQAVHVLRSLLRSHVRLRQRSLTSSRPHNRSAAMMVQGQALPISHRAGCARTA